VTQKAVLDEVVRLRDSLGITMVYVPHALAVVGSVADRIAVMYAGRLVEEGPADVVLSRPLHPYSRGLVQSIPDHVVPRRLEGIRGVAAALAERTSVCPFVARCDQSVARCSEELPELEALGTGHRVRCFEALPPPPPRVG